MLSKVEAIEAKTNCKLRWDMFILAKFKKR